MERDPQGSGRPRQILPGLSRLYSIGMSCNGMQVLYAAVNQRDDWVCERVFAPMDDMAALLREEKLPLVSLESFTPLGQFDVLGFTLQYDLCYTNVLTMLDLAGIPLVAAERTARASAGDCRRAVRGQSRADGAIHRPFHSRRWRSGLAGSVRTVVESENIRPGSPGRACGNGHAAALCLCAAVL